MSLIQDHYHNEAVGNHADLLIEQEPGSIKYILYRKDKKGNQMVISTHQHALESVKEKLEGEELKTEIIDKLRSFLKEGHEIYEIFNDGFLNEIRDIITQIEDEGEIKGGCGLSYCPKK